LVLVWQRLCLGVLLSRYFLHDRCTGTYDAEISQLFKKVGFLWLCTVRYKCTESLTSYGRS
jgi:hypothetical protein